MGTLRESINGLIRAAMRVTLGGSSTRLRTQIGQQWLQELSNEGAEACEQK